MDRDKIYYQCQRCTACCCWPGDVHLTEGDISAIAAFLQLEESDFIQEHTRLGRLRSGLSLLEKPDGSCVWLEGNNCLLQAAKPEQCRGFPNKWHFPGWRDICEAKPIRVSAADPRAGETTHFADDSCTEPEKA